MILFQKKNANSWNETGKSAEGFMDDVVFLQQKNNIGLQILLNMFADSL
jgi:hypothetical protein